MELRYDPGVTSLLSSSKGQEARADEQVQKDVVCTAVKPPCHRPAIMCEG